MKEPGSIVIPALIAALVVLGSASRPARAAEPGPSFDCKKAATPVEKAICRDAFIGFCGANGYFEDITYTRPGTRTGR